MTTATLPPRAPRRDASRRPYARRRHPTAPPRRRLSCFPHDPRGRRLEASHRLRTHPRRGDYAFLEEPHARDSLACWSAFNTARTWREFWAKLPQRYHARVDHPDHIDPELYAPEDIHPVDDTPFDGARLDPEGEFPPLAHLEAAAEWMPEDIVERYGSFQNGWVSGTWTVYPAEHAEAVADELRRRGYEVKRDDELIKYTCSYHASSRH